QDAPYCRWLINAETGVVISANVPGILKGIEAAAAHHRVHAQVHESARVEQAGPVALLSQQAGQGGGADVLVALGRDVQGRVDGAVDGDETLDRLGKDRVGVLEQERLPGQGGQVRHRVLRRAVGAQVTGRRRFQVDQDDIPPSRPSAETRQVVAVRTAEG